MKNLETYIPPRTKRFESRDSLIEEAPSLSEMGRREKRTREGIRAYMRRTNQHESWKAKRIEKISQETHIKKLEKKLFQEEYQAKRGLASSLVNLMYKKAIEEENLPYQRAIEYYYSRKRRKNNEIPFENLVLLFDTYYDALRKGQELSLKELGKLAEGISHVHVRRILLEVGLGPMAWECKNYGYKIPKTKLKAVERSFNLRLSNLDRANFLGIPHHVFSYKFPCVKSREEVRTNYAIKSQVYEAGDIGFKIHEISDLLDITIGKVIDIISDRENQEPKIIKILRKLYPSRKIQKPYL